MDSALKQELNALIKLMTLSGDTALNQNDLKKLKNICKKHNAYIDHAHKLLWKCLNRDHSEVRLSALLICDQLFQRSHAFRELMLKDLQTFLELTLETNMKLPLPPPLRAAKLLKTKATEVLAAWKEKYSEGYQTLALAANYLRTCKKINLQDVSEQNHARQQKEREKLSKLEALKKQKVMQIKQEISDIYDDLMQVCTEVDNCVCLLMPKPDEYLHRYVESCDATDPVGASTAEGCAGDSKAEQPPQPQDKLLADTEHEQNTDVYNVEKDSRKLDKNEVTNDASDSCDDKPDSDDDGGIVEDDYVWLGNHRTIRSHGITAGGVDIQLDVTGRLTVLETPENTDIVANVLDMKKVVQGKATTTVHNWIQELEFCNANEDIMKKVNNLRTYLDKVQLKLKKIDFVLMSKNMESKQTGADSEDEDSDDFENVEDKLGYEDDVPESLRHLVETTNEEDGKADNDEPQKKKHKPLGVHVTASKWSMTGDGEGSRSHDDLHDPTSSAATIAKLNKKYSNASQSSDDSSIAGPSGLCSGTSSSSTGGGKQDEEGKVGKLKDVPVLPFGMDLYHWGEKVEAPVVARYDMNHRFWAAPQHEEFVDKAAEDMMKRRVINFTGKFEPVKWKCRAPLGNGKLCERMDRHKCPFHGVVIARDDQGNPETYEDAVAEMKRMKRDDKRLLDNDRLWETPEVREMQQKLTEENTGMQLTRKGKGKGKGKKSGLTNLNATHSQRKREGKREEEWSH